MKRVALLFGGRSGEHEVSLRSAAAIFQHLDPGKYSVVCIGIDKKGVWYRVDPEEAFHREKNISLLRVIPREDNTISCIPGKGLFCRGTPIPLDIVFPVLHGTFGEDGTVQGLLELMGIPYVGSGVLGSALGMDKEKAKNLWKDAGVPIVPFLCTSRRDMETDEGYMDMLVSMVERTFDYPVFVKPASTGSSVGVSKVHRQEELAGAVEVAFTFDTRILIEKAVNAREIECSVIGNGNPRAFVPGEILPSGEFYDYDAKYIDEEGAQLIIPANLEESVLQRIRDLAVKAYRVCGTEGYARVDLFYDEEEDALFINEINTIPGFTEISMFPKMCEYSGLPFSSLLDALIAFGEEKESERSGVCYDYETYHR